MLDATAPEDCRERTSASGLLPCAEAFTVRIVEELHVLSLRHLAGGTAAVERALAPHQLMLLPKPGNCLGTDPCLVWTGPTEILLLTSIGAIAEDVLQDLEPGQEVLACAVDRSAGCVVFDLLGTSIDPVLHRLLDASAIPLQAPHATRARFVDVCAVVLRLGPHRAWVVVDRPCAPYAATWISWAWQAVASPR
jgi:hypothetical protein